MRKILKKVWRVIYFLLLVIGIYLSFNFALIVDNRIFWVAISGILLTLFIWRIVIISSTEKS